MDFYTTLIWIQLANMFTSLQLPATREPEISQRNWAHYGLMGVEGNLSKNVVFSFLVLASGFSAKDLGDLGFDEGMLLC